MGLAVVWLAITPVPAQEIGKLYATRPPQGSAFVRVVMVGNDKVAATPQINARDLPTVENGIASRYRAVRADVPINLSVNGATVGNNERLLPDRFYTIAVARDGANWKSDVIDEGAGGTASDLKAQLRFANLSSGCEATLRIADGPAVFETVPFKTIKSRAINPVEALLEASCGGSRASLQLPPLRSGDHYTLFFTQAGGKATLTGQFDETEPYRDR